MSRTTLVETSTILLKITIPWESTHESTIGSKYSSSYTTALTILNQTSSIMATVNTTMIMRFYQLPSHSTTLKFFLINQYLFLTIINIDNIE